MNYLKTLTLIQTRKIQTGSGVIIAAVSILASGVIQFDMLVDEGIVDEAGTYPLFKFVDFCRRGFGK